MENKDWRKEFDEKFFTKETFDWKNPTPSEIKEFIAESLLKSKQEEIEEKISRKRRLVGYGSDELEQQYEDRGFNSALDDLKPIITNLLK